MLQLMDRHKIDAAAIGSTVSVFDDWRAGNEETLELSKQYPKRFIPLVTVNPVLPAAFVAQRLADYKKRGARGVRLYPQHHHYSLTGTAAATHMLSAIQHLGFPVVLPARLIMHWGLPVLDAAEIEATVKKWPKIRFILSGNNYGEELWLTDFLQRYENVDMEISGAEGFRSVNYIVGAVGYRRVLFGAGVPLMYPACAVAKLRVLKLPSEQMEAIESGNARRLFQW